MISREEFATLIDDVVKRLNHMNFYPIIMKSDYPEAQSEIIQMFSIPMSKVILTHSYGTNRFLFANLNGTPYRLNLDDKDQITDTVALLILEDYIRTNFHDFLVNIVYKFSLDFFDYEHCYYTATLEFEPKPKLVCYVNSQPLLEITFERNKFTARYSDFVLDFTSPQQLFLVLKDAIFKRILKEAMNREKIVQF